MFLQTQPVLSKNQARQHICARRVQMLKKVTYLLFAAVYLGSYLVTMIGMTIETFVRHGVMAEQIGVAVCFLLTFFCFMPLWGIIAGYMDHRRGWIAVGHNKKIQNAIGLMMIHTMFGPISVLFHWACLCKYDKVFPTPQEAR